MCLHYVIRHVSCIKSYYIQSLHIKVKIIQFKRRPNTVNASEMINVRVNRVYRRKSKQMSLFILFEELHKCLLMHQACIPSITEDTQIPQTQFGKALINEVYRRIDIKRNRSLFTPSMSVNFSCKKERSGSHTGSINRVKSTRSAVPSSPSSSSSETADDIP